MVTPGLYKHYKQGDVYRVIGIGQDSGRELPVVVYEPTYEGAHAPYFVHLVPDFEAVLEWNGEMVPRFVRVDD